MYSFGYQLFKGCCSTVVGALGALFMAEHSNLSNREWSSYFLTFTINEWQINGGRAFSSQDNMNHWFNILPRIMFCS